MKQIFLPLVVSGIAWPCLAQTSTESADLPERSKTLGVVTVNGGQPSSLPTQIPTTIEGITREEIETRINATDSEDALKYLPSLLVRKRYIGDYNHAILSTRASGTGNSARSAVYADGILLSNYLGNGIANGSNYAPRWGLVTPEEIERVDVMYGPFSAAYPGNSAGAVVDYVTRMPDKLEAHVAAGYSYQNADVLGSSGKYRSWNTSASIGSRSAGWSYWINLSRSDSQGQPMTFPTVLQSAGVAGGAGTPVTGAIAGLNTTNQPWYILGAGTQYRTRQDHAKIKLAYDITPTLRASYTLGWWQNSARGSSETYLRGPDGQPVYSGNINIDGKTYKLADTAFGLSQDQQTHTMHGVSLKSHTQGEFDWELSASLYDYGKDQQRVPTVAQPAANLGGKGTLQDQGGTGWNTLAAKGTWRQNDIPGLQGTHIVDFGLGRDAYKLNISKYNVVGDWQSGPANEQSVVSQVGGRAETRYAWAQDSWQLAKDWKAVLGLRWEDWTASQGHTATTSSQLSYAQRSESHFSPKVALAYQLARSTTLKASLGRSVRFPTVGELYGATSGGALSFINDPNLKPEKSWTGELTAEQDLGNGLLRATWFHERTRDALYSQLIPGSTISAVQNVDQVKTSGLELAYSAQSVWIRGLDLGGSLTWANSRITANAANPASVGKWQPRVPRWRATAWATYKPDERWALTVAARYSGRQYSNLDNSDVHADTYMGASQYFSVDLRARYQIDRQLSAAFGIDNANNAKYWNFHPYPQRTFSASLRWDL